MEKRIIPWQNAHSTWKIIQWKDKFIQKYKGFSIYFVSRILPLPLLLLRTHFHTTIERLRGTVKKITVLLCEEHIKSSEKEPGLKLFNIDVIRQQIPLTKRKRLSSILPSWLYIVQPRPKNSFCDFQLHFSWSAAPAVRSQTRSYEMLHSKATSVIACSLVHFSFIAFCTWLRPMPWRQICPWRKWRQCQPWRSRRRWAVMIKNLGIANDLMLLLTLLTSLLTMPLLLLLPRKKNLCRSPSNLPNLPSFWKWTKSTLWSCFRGYKGRALLFPRSCPEVFGAKLFMFPNQ